MSRETDAEALDERIIAAIDSYALDEESFETLACDLFAHQFRYNAPYAAYARARGVRDDELPRRVVDIPAVPSRAFKDAVLSTVAPEAAAIWFETSGTTAGVGGRHYLESTNLYDGALVAGFDRALLADHAYLRYILLVPDIRRRPHSSLGYMMDFIARLRGDGHTGRYVDGDDLDLDGFMRSCEGAIADDAPVCIATTAFALVAVLDGLAERGRRFALPKGSRIMETGGFKGRSRMVERDALYRSAAQTFGIPVASIVAEYGMTELSSQYYDAPERRDRLVRAKVPPPWLRPIVVDPSGAPVPPGIVGAIRHIDCANRSSVVAIETEDLGALVDGGLMLLGREQGAELRGCSLDAEALAARS